ncbi:hypothetical protein [Moorella sp. Hama-1]|uniref:hypothetical protein n=1 Tax=Moorella sp. Hama-1 TaxID=2138101 RepID=UPI000D65169C|nr:hypothetical protein [Moorella sp. Hama-1]MDN5362226.1 hypothetical protein [Moorella sp. (in: firmicutes)]BCV20142.1 hypothetical protein hamaS1_02110 [Moorella sp. Hama-1]
MGYQAPVILLAAVVSLVAAYGWLWWQHRAGGLNYRHLVILVRHQGEFLEGILRHLCRWRYWHGWPLEFWVVAEEPCETTIAILRHFGYPYPCCQVQVSPAAAAITADLAPSDPNGVLLDLRKETNYFQARARLSQVYQKCQIS